MFELKITNTDGAAFRNDDTGEPDAYMAVTEIMRILADVQQKLKNDAFAMRNDDRGTCMDLCGNKVGEWRYSV